MFTVYVIKNIRGVLYKGYTSNIKQRLIEHNTGLSPYTKHKGPWELVYKEVYQTRNEALKRELFLKSGKGREFLKNIFGA